MSNLGFELCWAGGTTTLLTNQPQVGSQSNKDFLHVCGIKDKPHVNKENKNVLLKDTKVTFQSNQVDHDQGEMKTP
jgi:hypothetical protein